MENITKRINRTISGQREPESEQHSLRSRRILRLKLNDGTIDQTDKFCLSQVSNSYGSSQGGAYLDPNRSGRNVSRSRGLKRLRSNVVSGGSVEGKSGAAIFSYSSGGPSPAQKARYGASDDSPAFNVNRAGSGYSWRMLSRACEQIRLIGLAIFYNNPRCVLDALTPVGLNGKVGSMLALNPHVRDLLRANSATDQYPDEYVSSLVNLSSKNNLTVMSDEEVLTRVENQIIKNQTLKEGMTITYEKNLGSGTIANVAHVKINSCDYAVKMIAPHVSEALNNDINIAGFFIRSFNMCGEFTRSDMVLMSDFFNTVMRETDLNYEMKCTIKQRGIYKELASGRHDVIIVELKGVNVDEGSINGVNSTSDRYRVTVLVSKKMDGADRILDSNMISVLLTRNSLYSIPVNYKVPEVYEDKCGSDALVMELVEGIPFDLVHRDEMMEMLQSWKPSWNLSQPLSEGQAKRIIVEAGRLGLNFFLEAYKKSLYLNADFHAGNMMMALDGDEINIYFIDHGNCVQVRNDNEALMHNLSNFMAESIVKVYIEKGCNKYQLRVKDAEAEKNITVQIDPENPASILQKSSAYGSVDSEGSVRPVSFEHLQDGRISIIDDLNDEVLPSLQEKDVITLKDNDSSLLTDYLEGCYTPSSKRENLFLRAWEIRFQRNLITVGMAYDKIYEWSRLFTPYTTMGAKDSPELKKEFVESLQQKLYDFAEKQPFTENKIDSKTHSRIRPEVGKIWDDHMLKYGCQLGGGGRPLSQARVKLQIENFV